MTSLSPSLMGGEGSGKSQADPDPKGQVTLAQEDNQENLQILYSLEIPENDNCIEDQETEDTKKSENTPALMNCSNNQFNFKEKKNEEEIDFMRTTPSPKRSKTIEVPKGTINEKKRKYERNVSNTSNRKPEAKEPSKTNRD